ncbi:MAG: Calx-beta domain-containing protein, partial [Actinomycetota bacterium]
MPRNPFSVFPSLIAAVLVVVLLPLAPASDGAAALASDLTGLRVDPGAVFEGGSTTMILRSSTSSSTATDLNVRRIDGTATPGVDFVDVDVDVTMQADSTQVTVGPLTSIDDDLAEDLEEFIVLGIFDPAAPDMPLATSTISLIDDEPKFAFERPADQIGADRRTIVVEEPTSGTIDVEIPIESRSGSFPYRDFLSVSFFVDPIGSNSATLDADLTVLRATWNGPGSFGGSQDPPNITFRIAADDLDEGPERILLGLRHEPGWDGPGYFGTDDLIDITITDPTVDPVEPVVLSTDARDEVIAEGDSTVVTVRLVSPTDGSAEVRIVTVDGSATTRGGTDYKPIDTTVTLDSTTTSVDIPIDTGGDVIREDQFEDLAIHVFHLDSGEPDAATEPVLIERLLIEDDEPQVRFERDRFEFAEPGAGTRLVEIPVTALYGAWPFGSPLPSDDPEFDPTLGAFVDLTAEFVNPGTASTDAVWVQDTVRVTKGTEPAPFLLHVLADSDADIEELDIRLLRAPRLGGLVPGPFLDDTATIVIGPQEDDTLDPADLLRDALADVDLSFPTWTPPDLDLDVFDLDGLGQIDLPALG